ncbi:hypothetical protein [Mycetocola saprophilus]|uniref:hypothetical protein n=1 Tax=Mycetocola saprophilus TaxID=76636 RepID=UPI003BF10AD1
MSQTIAAPKPLFRLTAQAMLGVPSAFIAALILSQIGANTAIVIGGSLAAVVATLWALNRAANRVADLLGSSWIPWALWATVTASLWAGFTSLFEIGALFTANETGQTSGMLVPMMVITGVWGTIAALGAIGMAITTVVQLTRVQATRVTQIGH